MTNETGPQADPAVQPNVSDEGTPVESAPTGRDDGDDAPKAEETADATPESNDDPVADDASGAEDAPEASEEPAAEADAEAEEKTEG